MRHWWISLACLAAAAHADDARVAEAKKTLKAALEPAPVPYNAVARTCTAIDTLVKDAPDGLAPQLIQLAADKREQVRVRERAMRGLERLEGIPVEPLHPLLVTLLKDAKAPRGMRLSAAFILAKPEHSSEAMRATLQEVLLRPDEDHILQRSCLSALGRTADLDALRKLLVRKELAAHPYFGIRSDVCCGLASLKVRNRRALEILCTLMTDEDAKDVQLNVPMEAWLAFWLLTGRAHGVANAELFAEVPNPRLAEKDLRHYLFSFSYSRPWVKKTMVDEVQRYLYANSKLMEAARQQGKRIRPSRDDPAMKAAADASREEIDDILAEWKAK